MKFGLRFELGFYLFGALAFLACVYIVRVGALEKRIAAVEARDVRTAARQEISDTSLLGTLGHHEVDGEKSFGMFISIDDSPVFVDLREDELLEKRKEYAQLLAANLDTLAARFHSYTASSAALSRAGATEVRIKIIGCYRSDPITAETYLLLDGKDDGFACLLDHLDFIDFER